MNTQNSTVRDGEPNSFWQPIVCIIIWLVTAGCIMNIATRLLLNWAFPAIFNETILKVMVTSVSSFVGIVAGIATLPYITSVVIVVSDLVDFLKHGKG